MSDEGIRAPRPYAGPGYRLLEPREVLRAGDAWSYAEETRGPGGAWTLVEAEIGSTVAQVCLREGETELVFRRPVEDDA